MRKQFAFRFRAGFRVSIRALACAAGLSFVSGCSAHPRWTTPPAAPPADATWLQGTDNTRLFLSVVRPTTTALRCSLYFVMGPEVGSAPLYPEFSAKALTHGYALVSLHPRGTGYSDGLRGDIENYETFLGDLELGLQHTQSAFPTRPIVVFGHSEGATLALEVAARHAGASQALVLVNPAYKMRYGDGMGPTLGDYFAFAFNSLFRPAAITADMNRNPAAISFAPDREEGEAMQRDPFSVRYFSLRMLKARSKVMGRAPENAGKIDAPLVLVQGAHDVLVDPAGNDEILAHAKNKDHSKLLAPRGGHGSSAIETMTEPLLAWLDARCAASVE